MLIGILSLRNNRYHPNRRLLEASKALGHQAILINPKKVFMGVGREGFSINHISSHLRVDSILPRIGANIREYPLTMIRQFELKGIRVINNYNSILLACNKFLTLQALIREGVPVPESRYASNISNFKSAVKKSGGFPLVIKTTHGRQGRGVFLIDSMEKHGPLLDNLLHTGHGIIIQKFIPPEKRRDIRVMVVGKRVAGAMSLTPVKGDFRANIHLNSRAENIRLTRGMTGVALKSTRALGLDISGVDMIEEEDGRLRVVDVNYSPGFKGLEKCTGMDVATEIIKHVTGRGK